jgi:CRISPR-associated protein Cmr4
MSDNAILGLITETPLHPGSGQSSRSIDLPVQRERHTGYPYIPSSSLKGALRSTLKLEQDELAVLFGPDAEANTHFAGAIALSDTRILAFPTRTMKNVFVWVTSPLVYDRLKRDLDLIGYGLNLPKLPVVDDDTALVTSRFGNGSKILLEDLWLNQKNDEAVGQYANVVSKLYEHNDSHKYFWEKFNRDLVVISDSNLQHILQFGTQVVARNQLDEKKQSRNLWYMEQLPRDTLLYSIVIAEPSFSGVSMTADEVLLLFIKGFFKKYIQVGGNETLGQGWCKVSLERLDGGI